MANSLFKLVGSIFIDNEEANNSIAKTDEKAKSTASTLASGVTTAAKWGAAVTGAAVGVAGSMVALANDVAGTANEIDKASIRMGVDTDYYQELSYAAGQCGVEMSTMEKAAKKLEGTDLSMDEAMEQIMSLRTETERSAMAAELFGEAVAYQMAPMLAQSGADVKGLMKQAKDLGMVMSKDAVQGGVKLGDTLDTLKKSFGGVVAQLGSSLMPIIQSVLDKVVEFLPTIMGLADQLSPIIGALLEGVLPPLLDLGATIFPVLLDVINQLLPPITDIATTLLPVFVELLAPLLELLSPLLDLTMALLKPLLDLISTALKPLTDVLVGIINIAIKPLELAIKGLKAVFGPVFDAISKSVGDSVGGILNVFKGIIDFVRKVFKGDFQGAWISVINAFKAVWNTMESIIKAPINLGIGFINGMINGIEKAINFIVKGLNKLSFDVPDWVPELGGKKFGFNLSPVDLKNIPYLAEGGIVDSATKGQLFVANESGPELVHSYDGKTAVSNNADVLRSIKEAVGDEMANAMKPIEEILKRIASIIPQEINIDGKTASKILAPEMNRQLGLIRGATR